MVETMEEYVNSLYKEDQALQQVKASLEAEQMPDVCVAPMYGRLLTFLVQVSRARRVLEIGALGGYSGICLARGLHTGGTLLSLELKQQYADIARYHIELAGFGAVTTYKVGPAQHSLQLLAEQKQKFDFFLIDADKPNYPLYLEYAIVLSQPGAIIVGDNCGLRGRTYNSKNQSVSVRAMRTFNEQIAADPRLMSVMLPSYDGLAVAQVIASPVDSTQLKVNPNHIDE